MIGRPLFDVFPEARGSIFEERYRQALRAKEPDLFETYFGVDPYDDWYDVRVYPYRDGISVFFQVITERKQAEQTLRESEEKYRTLVEQSLQGVVIARRGGGTRETFTVRKMSGGIGVERVFPLHSPVIANIEVVRRGRVRRAKLYYLRKLRGKAARIQERRLPRAEES